MGVLFDRTRYWNATAAERVTPAPCDALLAGPANAIVRAVDVAAPAAVVFRWLCQLKVAPYSYDLLDNLGRRSPRELTPGADELATGQRFLVMEIVDFEPDRHVSGRIFSPLDKLFGTLALTYSVQPRGQDASRLVCRMVIGAPRTPLGWLRRELLCAGDLVMMRKQLLTLKARAEASTRRPAPVPA